MSRGDRFPGRVRHRRLGAFFGAMGWGSVVTVLGEVSHKGGSSPSVLPLGNEYTSGSCPPQPTAKQNQPAISCDSGQHYAQEDRAPSWAGPVTIAILVYLFRKIAIAEVGKAIHGRVLVGHSRQRDSGAGGLLGRFIRYQEDLRLVRGPAVLPRGSGRARRDLPPGLGQLHGRPRRHRVFRESLARRARFAWNRGGAPGHGHQHSHAASACEPGAGGVNRRALGPQA